MLQGNFKSEPLSHATVEVPSTPATSAMKLCAEGPTLALQVLTHMREKLQFVQRRNRVLAREGAKLESDLGSKRDSLAHVKQRRDRLRHTARKIKESSVYIDNPMLLADMQTQAHVREELLQEIDDLQDRKVALAARVAEMTSQIVALSEVAATPGVLTAVT
jgi:chromosome segregation ATPase